MCKTINALKREYILLSFIVNFPVKMLKLASFSSICSRVSTQGVNPFGLCLKHYLTSRPLFSIQLVSSFFFTKVLAPLPHFFLLALTWSCKGLSPEAAAAAIVDGMNCTGQLSPVGKNNACRFRQCTGNHSRQVQTWSLDRPSFTTLL